MKNNRNPLYSAMRYALAAGVVSGFGASGAAVAQDEDVAELERVEVTGSRIKRTDVETAAPVTVMDREAIERTGLKDLAQIIQRIPSFTGSPVNTQINNGNVGGGNSLIDMRGFGSARTLVLINGQRAAFSGDLSSIPAVMVERIEVLKDGASAIYGADAVAGVVNIITRDDFEGAEFQTQYRYFSDSGTDEENVSMILGGSSDRGNFVAGVEYFDIEGAFQGDIQDNEAFQDAFTVLDPDAYREAGGSGAFRPGMPGVISLGSSRTPEGVFDAPEFANSLTLRDGASGTSPEDFRPFVSGGPDNDTYNYAPVNYMQTPQERYNLFAQGRYELFENVEAFTLLQYQNRRSEQILAPLPYDTAFDPGFPVQTPSGLTVGGVSADNAYNPFGHDITGVRRRMVETGGRRFTQEVNRSQIVAGFEGAFELGGRFYDWTLSYNFSRDDQSNTDFGQFLGSRLERALGPSFFNDQGEAVCGTPENPDPSCVPLNVFGGPGSITPEMIDFVSKPVTDVFKTQQQIVNGVVSGNIADLPAGPLGVAVGFEWRDQDFQSIPAAAKATNAVTGNAFEGTEGFKRITSGFVEFSVPLLADMPAVEILELNASARRDTFDQIAEDSTTFQTGIRWQPTQDILVRGTFSEVFREPTINDLFAGAADSFPTAGDPCADFTQLTSAQVDNCIADGVPADGSYDQEDSQPRTIVGGNPNVQPEEGETKTLGIAWSPGFVEGLNVTVDWWDIELEDNIGSLSAQTILEECALNGNVCNLTNRFPSGRVDFLEANTQNLGTLTGSGVDLEVTYDLNTEYGLFSNRVLTTYLDDRQTSPFEGAPAVDQDGNYDILQAPGTSAFAQAAYPHWKLFYDLAWSYGDWGVSYQFQWIDDITEFGSPFGIFSTAETFEIDSQSYHDLLFSYNFGQTNTVVEFGVNNVTDEEAPFINQGSNGTTDPSTYRVLGRNYFLRLTQSF